MKQFKAKLKIFFPAVLMAMLLMAFSTEARAGLDSYAIYLNDKLILKQAVNEPLTLESLHLTKANAADKLVIYYSQCNAENKIGKGRSLAIRDEKGNVIKEWKFSNSDGREVSMVIPVKELLQLDKSIAQEQLTLFYSAEGHEKGQKLMTMKVAAGTTSYAAPRKQVISKA